MVEFGVRRQGEIVVRDDAIERTARACAENGWAIAWTAGRTSAAESKAPRNHSRARPETASLLAGLMRERIGERNCGIALAQSRPPVVAFDDDSDGAALPDWWDELPPTVTTLTGRGERPIYRSPDGPAKVEIESNGGVKVAGGDTFVVMPPSRRAPDDPRAPWRWKPGHAPWEHDVAEIPLELLERIRRDHGGGGSRAPADPDEPIGEGGRNEALFSIALRARRAGASGGAIAAMLAEENSTRCRPPLPRDEVEQVAASAVEYAHKHPTEFDERPSETAGAVPDTDPTDVDLEEVLREVEQFIRAFCLVTNEQAAALTLWTAHTHAIEAAEATPYILVTSAEKRSGKSRLMEVCELLAAGSRRTASISPAAIFRMLDSERVTLLMDELDATFSKRLSERSEELRGILNDGYRRGGCVYRCVGQQSEVRGFPVFGPKMLAGIGHSHMPDTIADRSIQIRLKRARQGEVRKLRMSQERGVAAPLRARLAASAQAHLEQLRDARPDVPEILDDRAQDVWEPLMAIADAAGGAWPERARQAALALSGVAPESSESYRVRLLGDLREVFVIRDAKHLPTETLLHELKGREDAPWAAWYDGKSFGPRDLSRALREFDIRPGTIRLADGSTPKGYKRSDFEDAWERYLPEHPIGPSPWLRAPESATAPHPVSHEGFGRGGWPGEETDLPLQGSAPHAGCGDVADAAAFRSDHDAGESILGTALRDLDSLPVLDEELLEASLTGTQVKGG